MRLPSLLILGFVFAAAAGLSLVAATYAVTGVEQNTEIAVRRTLDTNGHDWAEVQADGLRVILSGTAPDETRRFNALSKARGIVDAARIIDRMDVAPTADLAPPRFSAEILRNDSGISIIGLIPSTTDRGRLLERLGTVGHGQIVTDLLETASFDAPDGWSAALDYAVTSLAGLPRSKVSVDAERVAITAITDSAAAKTQLETELARAAPPGLRLSLNISAPRPVITPFTLRFLIDEDGARFDACSADSRIARGRILSAARKAGLNGTETCTIGMGVPSPRWSEAAAKSIGALARIGNGSITMVDADISLVATPDTDPALFDLVVGELETDLPPVFALHATLPEPEEQTLHEKPEFTATLSPEGLVQLRGRLGDETQRTVVTSFAQAHFGSEAAHMAARVVPDLPPEWPVRVLAGLEALSLLTNGIVTVTGDALSLSGVTQDENANSKIARLLADKLGDTEPYFLDITYRAPPEPVDTTPPPEECEARIAAVQATGKITFEPGSANITSTSLDSVNAIAAILEECGDIRLEIQGHTDSQGREEMNQQLSQARAQSVLNMLRARRILTSSYVARGYGESTPIADNDTEEGREANRRIEFRLIETDIAGEDPETEGEAPTGEEAAPTGEEEETPNEQN